MNKYGFSYSINAEALTVKPALTLNILNNLLHGVCNSMLMKGYSVKLTIGVIYSNTKDAIYGKLLQLKQDI